MTASLPGRVFEGIVEGFERQIDSTTRTIKVRAMVDNAEGLMLPGMIFNVVLSRENAPLPSVPAVALTWSREGASVWVVEDGKAQTVSAAIRHRANDTVWLEADLKPGQQVVVEGVQKLREGAAVVTGGEPPASGPADISDAGGPPAKSRLLTRHNSGPLTRLPSA